MDELDNIELDNMLLYDYEPIVETDATTYAVETNYMHNMDRQNNVDNLVPDLYNPNVETESNCTSSSQLYLAAWIAFSMVSFLFIYINPFLSIISICASASFTHISRNSLKTFYIRLYFL